MYANEDILRLSKLCFLQKNIYILEVVSPIYYGLIIINLIKISLRYQKICQHFNI